MQLSSVERDRTKFKPLAVGEFLKEMESSWTARFSERGLQLEIEIENGLSDFHIAASPNNLKQIADNLLSNMIRYASAESPCRVTATLAARQQSVQLEFRNTAPDIDETSTSFLFDRFFRVSNSRTREHDEHPTGLVLSIVKQLCLSCGGNATAVLDAQELVISLVLPLGGRIICSRRSDVNVIEPLI